MEIIKKYKDELKEKLDKSFEVATKENIDQFNNLVCSFIDKLNDFNKGQKEKRLIKQIEENLNKKGYVCVSQAYINGSYHYHFINKETFDYIGINDEDLDEENLWDILGVTEKEIEEKVMDLKSNNKDFTNKEELTEAVEKAIGNYEDKDYKKVIRDFITANEELIKD